MIMIARFKISLENQTRYNLTPFHNWYLKTLRIHNSELIKNRKIDLKLIIRGNKTNIDRLKNRLRRKYSVACCFSILLFMSIIKTK